jgi:alpha-tubulin suppressor-like RCC1 family protein
MLQTANSEAQPVTQISAGSSAYHGLFLKSDGSLWGMGYNQWGQLGIGKYNFSAPYGVNLPTQALASNVTAIAVGGGVQGHGHSLFIKSDGSLWGMGNNSDSQLSVLTLSSVTPNPVMIVASNVTAVAAGEFHSLFLKSNGSLWGMGLSTDGQLGLGTNGPFVPYFVRVPTQIVVSNVVAIAAGLRVSFFIKSDGSLWGMGNNSYGQLGLGYNSYPGVNIPTLIVASNVTAVAAGGGHTLFMKNDGSLWAMGYNENGQLGTGFAWSKVPVQVGVSNVTAIAAGGDHSLFIQSDGSLWGMGENSHGQLGFRTNQHDNGRPFQIIECGVTTIAAGADYTLFLRFDGSLWSMGNNIYGQLGNGTFSSNVAGTNGPEQIFKLEPTPSPMLQFQDSSPIILECTNGSAIGTVDAQVEDSTGNSLEIVWTVDGVPLQTNDVPSECGIISTNLSLVGTFESGEHVVAVSASNGQASPATASTAVSVRDTTPPQIENVEACPNILWPPDKRMIPVQIKVDAIDNCDAMPEGKIINVSSNERENQFQQDWEITGPLSLNLRADRLGTQRGRIYTIEVQCADSSGNVSYATVEVAVPHDLKRSLNRF